MTGSTTERFFRDDADREPLAGTDSGALIIDASIRNDEFVRARHAPAYLQRRIGDDGLIESLADDLATTTERVRDWVDISLEYGPSFACLTELMLFSFGTTALKGLKAVKTLLTKIGGNLATVHRTLDLWHGKNCQIFRGDADLHEKVSDEAKIVDFHMWILHGNKTRPGKFERSFIVNGPVQTDAII